jgi:hypothetical protein
MKPPERINKDGYYQINVKLEDGFRFKIPARGFNLKSLVEFEKSLDSVTEHSFKEITKKEFEKMTIGTEEKQAYRKRK